MRPGSLSKQYSVCGKAGCRCVDREKPRKHGPYYQLSYVHRGAHRRIKPRFLLMRAGQAAPEPRLTPGGYPNLSLFLGSAQNKYVK